MSQNQFSFPTVPISGMGQCLTRKILIDRGNVSGSDIYNIQDRLIRDTDYSTVTIEGSPCAQNVYSLGAVLKISQLLPTEDLQAIAQEIRTAMYEPQAIALPASASSPEPRHVSPTNDYADYAPTQGFGVPTAAPIVQRPDQRIEQLGKAIAHNIEPRQSSQQLTQQQLLDGAIRLQETAAGHVRAGFDMAMSAQTQTADTIRHSRPNVTNNSDNRRVTSVYDYANNSVTGMGRLQFGILCSALFCVASAIVFGVASMNADRVPDNRHAPSSYTRGN